MSTDPPAPLPPVSDPTEPTLSANVELSMNGWQFRANMTVPAGPVPLRIMLPVLQSLADGMVDLAARVAEEKGKTVSCKKGCGACCRQLVPISEVEARRIHDLIEEMPEPRRSLIRSRFDDAQRRLGEAGLLARLENRQNWSEQEFRTMGLDYFKQGIPCPFLEEESCSIHPERPITCREYLVTSPAENCARPTAENIEPVPLAVKVWTAVAQFNPAPPGSRYLRWVPLVLAPVWAAQNHDDLSPRPGPEWLRELFARLSARERTSAAQGSLAVGDILSQSEEPVSWTNPSST